MLEQFVRDRESYSYVPAHLVQADADGTLTTWSGRKLNAFVPVDWQKGGSAVRSKYSSMKLDRMHRELLMSESDEDLEQGVMSVYFWGHASGTDDRVNDRRAHERAKWLPIGKSGGTPQPQSEVVDYLRRARQHMREGRVDQALLSAMNLKHFKMSFASKLLAFLSPDSAGVYDKVIGDYLPKDPDATLKTLGLDTQTARPEVQTATYARWCDWCRNKATELNVASLSWKDWDGQSYEWRALDVERAIFARASRSRRSSHSLSLGSAAI